MPVKKSRSGEVKNVAANESAVAPENVVNVDHLPGDAALADVVSEIVEQAPEVQEHVIAAHADAAPTGDVDSDGASYDPSQHAEPPQKTAAGRWRKRRTIKKASASVVNSPPMASANAGEDTARLHAQAAGATLAQLTFLMGRMIGGDEWTPIVNHAHGVDEVTTMTDAYTQYCISKGVQDVPPGAILVSALIAYAAPRFTQPKTQARVGAFKKWIFEKYVSWRTKREERARTNIGEL